MDQPFDPKLNEDAKNFTAILASAFVALLGTGAILAAALGGPPRAADEAPLVLEPGLIFDEIEIVEAAVDADAGADRLYGAVRTTEGEEIVGYLRWNGGAASWADLFDATEPGGNRLAGVRFGHLARMERVDARSARVFPKLGEPEVLVSRSAERHLPTRPLRVREPGAEARELAWSAVESIDFLPEPISAAPPAERLHGTVLTRSGLGLTGYVSWGDDAFSDDLLEGWVGSESRDLPFASIATVVPTGPEAAWVTGMAGEQALFEGGADIGRGVGAVTVSDPALGTVVVPWTRLREVRFHPPDAPAAYDAFDGGRPLRGTVVTRAGERLAGTIAWDRDEASTRHTLDGLQNEVQLHVDFGRIDRIERFRLGAKVTLRDGRVLQLIGTNDVNWNNRGVIVTTESGRRELSWEEFASVRFDASADPGG